MGEDAVRDPQHLPERHLETRKALLCHRGHVRKLRQPLRRAGGDAVAARPHLAHDAPQRLLHLVHRGHEPRAFRAGEDRAFLGEGLVDELIVYLAPTLLGQGAGMSNFGPLQQLSEGLPLQFQSVERAGKDLRILARGLDRDLFLKG